MQDFLISPTERAQRHQRLLEYRTSTLLQSDCITKKVKLFGLSLLILAQDHHFFVYPISHLHGFHLWVLLTDRPVGADLNTDLNNLMLLTMERLRDGIALGYTLPGVVVSTIIEQCQYIMMTHQSTVELCSVLGRFIEYLTQDYRPVCRLTVAVQSAQPTECMYELKILTETTLPLRARSIHDIGIKEASRTIEKIKYRGGKTGNQKPLECKLSSLHRLKVALVDCVHVPPLMYAFTPSRPVVVVNTHNIQMTGLHCLLNHEIFPGHHLEVTRNYDKWGKTDVWWLSGFPGYVEGWATFCEQFCVEDAQCEYLQLELLRDLRLVVDTGIHSLECGRWTFPEAVEFMASGEFRGTFPIAGFSGLKIPHRQITLEVLGIVSKPAYALSYKLGKLWFGYYYQRALDMGLTQTEAFERLLSMRVPLCMLPQLIAVPCISPIEESDEMRSIMTGHWKGEYKPIHVSMCCF
jgi:uncharacterized protein (DUF885 family)